jgi:hypothetical protein
MNRRMPQGWERSMPIALRLLVCLCATSLSVTFAQQAKTTKTTNRSHTHHPRSSHHAKHAGSKPATQTATYVNQGPLAPTSTEPEVAGLAVATEPASQTTPEVEPVLVTYERGALTIATHDAPLREVLDKVRDATGAVVDAPDLDQRVSVTLPAEAPLQAIAGLLDGMHLDYAMLGGTTVDDPVRKIIIAPRLGTAPGHLASATGLNPVPGRTPGALSSQPPGGDEGAWENAPARPARNH